MPKNRATLAILFADIVQSTQLYETLGNNDAQAIINHCLKVLGKIAERFSGTVIKTIGDEVMCTFAAADDAVKAGREMNQSIQFIDFPGKPGWPALNIHMGIDYGTVICESGDVFGEAINVAARMVDLAKPRQIVATEATIAALSPEVRASANHIDSTVVKGKKGALNIYELIWEKEDVTIMLDEATSLQTFRCRIELRIQDTVLDVDENRPCASLGRQLHNDIVVESNRVSRSHARVEYRRGKFLLIDQSTNGTFVTIEGKKAIKIKRDELILIGSGVIGLGKQMTAEAPDAIHFNVKI